MKPEAHRYVGRRRRGVVSFGFESQLYPMKNFVLAAMIVSLPLMLATPFPSPASINNLEEYLNGTDPNNPQANQLWPARNAGLC